MPRSQVFFGYNLFPVGIRGTSLGPRIKAAIKRSPLNATQVAERAGITQSVVSRYCSGDRIPSVTILTRLARVLSVSTDELLGLPALDEDEKLSKAQNKIRDLENTLGKLAAAVEPLLDRDTPRGRRAGRQTHPKDTKAQ